MKIMNIHLFIFHGTAEAPVGACGSFVRQFMTSRTKHMPTHVHITLDRFKAEENNTMYKQTTSTQKRFLKAFGRTKGGSLIIEINASDAQTVLEFLFKRAAFFPICFYLPNTQKVATQRIVCVHVIAYGWQCVCKCRSGLAQKSH